MNNYRIINLENMKTGIGLRAPHIKEFLDKPIDVSFVEVHPENYFGGGFNLDNLIKIANRYKLSLHGVGLSLGSVDGLDKKHLQNLKKLIDLTNPILVSEHLSWNKFNHINVPDLLPLPFNNEALEVFIKHINIFQDFIGRQILIENPSNYIAFKNTDYSEPDFLNILASKTGCGILLDVNNIYVSSKNIGLNAADYINKIEPKFVKEIHLAGFTEKQLDNGNIILIDTHGNKIFDPVWQLYEKVLQKIGSTPTLIEWDSDIPALDVLLKEAKKADEIKEKIFSKNEAA